jgi:hypothetical protein
VHDYDLRRAELLYVPLCGTKLRQLSVSYQGSSFLVVITLSNDTRNAPTLQQFLFKLKNFFFSRLQYVFNTWVSNPDMPNLVKPI